MHVTIDKYDLLALLEWCDAAFRTCEHLGMLGHERGAYLLLSRAVGHVPEVRGVKRPDLIADDPIIQSSP